MIPDQHNWNCEYSVREFHLILEQILDVFISEEEKKIQSEIQSNEENHF